jgi:hypothetical protein
MIASAALLDPQIAHLAVIAERLETIAETLTRPPAPIPPTPNGNGHNGASLPPSPDEHTGGEDDPARQVEHLHDLRADIDAQLRKLQQP